MPIDPCRCGTKHLDTKDNCHARHSLNGYADNSRLMFTAFLLMPCDAIFPTQIRDKTMRTLLVASEGGHLVELELLARRLGISDRAWVTFDSPQSRSLLADEEVYHAPFAGSRDFLGTARATLWARKLLAQHNFENVVSTGASIALAVLPLASRAGADCSYVESATRISSPSLTGRMLEPFRPVKLFTQYERWANTRWKYSTSIFDEFQSEHSPVSAYPPQRVLVSFGLHRGFSFRRAVERILAILPKDTEVVWQVGDTDVSGLNINAHVTLPTDELNALMHESDAIITHAGIGSIISALRMGKRPVVLPRRKEYREHVDDHQAFIAQTLHKRSLVFHAEADQLRWEDVVATSAWHVRPPHSSAGGRDPAPADYSGRHNHGRGQG